MTTIEVNTRELVKIGKFVRRLSDIDFTEAMDTIGFRLVGKIRLQFRLGLDPFGNPWLPLSDNTRAAKNSDGAIKERRILVDKGILEKSFIHEPNSDYVRIGTPLEYAEYHNEGTQRIPRRQILPEDRLPASWSKVALEEIDDHLKELIRDANIN